MLNFQCYNYVSLHILHEFAISGSSVNKEQDKPVIGVNFAIHFAGVKGRAKPCDYH